MKRGEDNCFKEAPWPSAGKGLGMKTESTVYMYFRKEKICYVLSPSELYNFAGCGPFVPR